VNESMQMGRVSLPRSYFENHKLELDNQFDFKRDSMKSYKDSKSTLLRIDSLFKTNTETLNTPAKKVEKV
jgi:hypothetical protein